MKTPDATHPGSHLPPLFLLAGGGSWRSRKSPDPILATVFAETCRTAPSIAYVGAASDDDRNFLRWLTTLFKAAGAAEVRLAPTVHQGSDLDETRRVLDNADLVFVSGGDVDEGMRILARRGLAGYLRRLHRAGKPFFGLSAGSIMLARSWVRWADPDDDSTAEAFECLGLAPVLCDTHAEDDDWEELHALLRLCPDKTVGYGIPSGGALVVSPEGTVRALGKPLHPFRTSTSRIEALPPLPVWKRQR